MLVLLPSHVWAVSLSLAKLYLMNMSRSLTMYIFTFLCRKFKSRLTSYSFLLKWVCYRAFTIKYSYSLRLVRLREAHCTKTYKKSPSLSHSDAFYDAIEHTCSRNGMARARMHLLIQHAPIHVCVLYKWYHQVPVIFRARRIIPADTCQRHLLVRGNRWNMKIILLTPRICSQLLRIL